MSMKEWEKKVLAEPGAADRVAAIEDGVSTGGTGKTFENGAVTGVVAVAPP